MNAGTLTVEIGADPSGLARGFDTALSKVESFGNKLKNLGQTLALAVSLPLALAGGAALKMAADMEQASVSFRVLLKDANLAKYAVGEFKKFSAETPFEFSEVQGGAKQLLSYGVALKDVIPTLTNAGDLASGMGVNLGEVVSAMGRLKAGNFGEAFERFREFGIARDQLEGKGLKFDKSGSYKGSVDAALKAVQDVIKERFGGQMAEQSKTLGGIFSNAKDQISFFLTDIGDAMVQAFNLKEIGPKLISFLGTIREGFSSLSPVMQKVVLGFGALLTIGPPLLVALGGLIAAWPLLTAGIAAVKVALAGLLGPVGLVVAAVAGLAYAIYTNWDSIKSTLTETGVWEDLKGIVRGGLGAVASLFGVFANALTGDWSNMWEHMKNTVYNVGIGFMSAAQSVLRPVATLFGNFFRGMGMDWQADWMRRLATYYDGTIAELRAKVPPLTNALGTIQNLFDGAMGGGKPKPGAGGGLGKGEAYKMNPEIKRQLDEWKKELQAMKEMWAGVRAYSARNPITGLMDIGAMKMPTIKAPDFKNTETPFTGMLEGIARMRQQMNEELIGAAQDAFVGMGNVIGGLLAGTSSIKSLPQMLLGVLGNAAQQLGKLAIGIGLAVEGIKKSFFGLTGAGAIAAGIALVALGSFATSKAASIGQGAMKRYGTGGIVNKPTYALVGDTPPTDPEAILRLSQLSGIVQNAMTSVMPRMGAVPVNSAPRVVELHAVFQSDMGVIAEGVRRFEIENNRF